MSPPSIGDEDEPTIPNAMQEAYRSRYLPAASGTARTPTASAPIDRPSIDSDERDRDPDAEFEQQHQSLLMEQQDRTLTDIAGTVGLLREQARVIGTEVGEQNALLDELDQQADSISSRLAKAQRQMDRFLRDNSASPSSWFILALILVLCLLLFIILFT
ncbi:Tlg1p [Sporobolomyces koalae]|uniref:Tlg1p n=1 Tax=Sporobolomyces koalae TaxID=500713 RepID=UPI00317C122E